MSGFYLMHRGWQDNPVFNDEPFSRRDAWVWLIEAAKFKPTRVGVGGKTIVLERGQLTSSLRFMAKAWKWDEARVRRFIVRLQTAQMIRSVINAGQTVITICNYEQYQTLERVADAAPDAAATQERRSTDANLNEGNEDIITPLSPNGDSPPHSASCDRAVAAWNTVAAENGLSAVRSLSPQRRQKLRLRLREIGGIEAWEAAMAKIRGSPFCLGRNDRNWTADFDFFLKPNKALKLLEGSYDERNGTGGQREPSQLRGFEAAVAGASAALGR